MSAAAQGNLGAGLSQSGDLPYVYLTRRESALLALLEKNAGSPVSNDQIVSQLFADRPPDKNTLAVYVHNLRKKLRFRRDLRIDTVLNQGYMLIYTDPAPR